MSYCKVKPITFNTQIKTALCKHDYVHDPDRQSTELIDSNYSILRPVQTGNVWRPNIIKHCLVTKHADVEVSGQMVKTCLIKHRSNNGYTSHQASVVRMPAPNMFDTAVQTNKTSPIKHESKRNVLSCLIECLMAFKFYQTRPNTIKHHQTGWPNGKMFGHQTMFDDVWSPNISRLNRPLHIEINC